MKRDLEGYGRLLQMARSVSRPFAEAEDVLQEAVTVALRSGRSLTDTAWIYGVMRNVARNAQRRHYRQVLRDGKVWVEYSLRALPAPELAEPEHHVFYTFAAGLPAGLRRVWQLFLSGHSRTEIRYLLGVSDEALRQRIVQLRLRLRRAGVIAPPQTGLSGGLMYGLMRQALRPALRRTGAALGSHDPDGHLFLIGAAHKTGRGGHRQI